MSDFKYVFLGFHKWQMRLRNHLSRTQDSWDEQVLSDLLMTLLRAQQVTKCCQVIEIMLHVGCLPLATQDCRALHHAVGLADLFLLHVLLTRCVFTPAQLSQALDLACSLHTKLNFELLLRYGAQPTEDTLETAARLPSIDFIERIYQHQPTLTGTSALNLALVRGDYTTFILLISHRAVPSRDAVYAAVAGGNVQCVDFFRPNVDVALLLHCVENDRLFVFHYLARRQPGLVPLCAEELRAHHLSVPMLKAINLHSAHA